MLDVIMIGALVAGGLLALYLLAGFYTVSQNSKVVLERFGRFHSIKGPGLKWRFLFVDTFKRTVSFELQSLPTSVQTKLKDNAFVKVDFVQQFWISQDDEDIKKLVYSLGASYEGRISERVHNEARSVLNKLDMNEVFDKKDDVGHQVEVELKSWLKGYGITLDRTLTNDVTPEAGVVASMNAKKKAEFDVQTAELKAEAEYKLTVRAAEARRAAKIADGQGIAGQRKALFENIKETVLAMKEAFGKGVPESVILDHVLELQRLDTQEQIAKNSRTATLFVPVRTGGISEQILQGNLAADQTREVGKEETTTEK